MFLIDIDIHHLQLYVVGRLPRLALIPKKRVFDYLVLFSPVLRSLALSSPYGNVFG